VENAAQHRREIAGVIEQYRRGFATLDVETLIDIWDQSYENVIYIAQEASRPIRGRAAVRRYYDRVAGLLRVRELTVSDLTVEVIGEVAFAFCAFHFEGEIKGKHHVADGRNTFILRRNHGSWKVIHYHESAPGPLDVEG
jgi:ketosteroid isomerase-like protein